MPGILGGECCAGEIRLGKNGCPSWGCLRVCASNGKQYTGPSWGGIHADAMVILAALGSRRAVDSLEL